LQKRLRKLNEKYRTELKRWNPTPNY
jgi:hypothetical protein